MSGPSGSGKSTHALVLCAEDATLRYVGYDQLRMLHPLHAPGSIMRLVIASAGRLLAMGLSVVVDAVNTHPHDLLRWEAVAWAFGVQLEWLSMSTSLEECIARDSVRSDPVGEARIREQVA